MSAAKAFLERKRKEAEAKKKGNKSNQNSNQDVSNTTHSCVPK